MKIILRYIFNNIKEHKLRTTVMLLSILMSATLIFVASAIGASYESAQKKMAKGFAGKAALSVTAKPAADGDMALLQEKEIPELSSIKSKVGILSTTALYIKDGYYENIDIIAGDIDTLSTINKPRLLKEAKLTNFDGFSIVLPEKFTTKYGVRPGDSVVLTIGGIEYKFTLAAIAAYDTIFLRQTRGFNALLPKGTLSQILQASSGNSKILIEPADGISADDLISELTEVMPKEHYNFTKVYDKVQIASDAKEKSLPFYLISFFSLTMSVFIIFSSYKVITMERLPVIGTFRSIGATVKVTTNILLLESLVYGIIGGILSIPFGCIVLKLLLGGLGKSLSLGIDIPMVVNPVNMILSCGLAIIVSLFSAFLPVRRASKLPVKEVVLGRVEENRTSNKFKLGCGVVLFLLSILLPRIIDKENKLLMAAGGFSLFGLIVAVIIVIPLITNIFSIILEHFYGLLFGNEGRLAARNMRDNKNINQNVTLLFISLSAVIAISVVGSFAASYIGDVFGGASLDGFANGDMSAEFIEKIESFEGIEEVLPIYTMNDKINADNKPFKRVEGIANLERYDSMLDIKYDNKETQMSIETVFSNGRNVLLNKDSLRQLGLKIGEYVNLIYKSKKFTYKIIGSFQSRADSSEAIIPAVYAESDFETEYYGMVAYTAVDPEAVIVQIRNLFANKFNWSRTVEEFNKDVLGTIQSFFNPMQKLTYFILLLAAVGIINNLLINYIQKKHAIAMYKSIGMSNRQNIKMTIMEGLTSGIIGAAVGIFASYMEIKTIFIVAGPRISVEPEIDFEVFLLAGFAGIIITLIGSVVPIIKGSKMNLVEEIKFE